MTPKPAASLIAALCLAGACGSNPATNSTDATDVGDAVAVLSWVAPTINTDGSALVDLAGYRIYHGTSSRAYTDSVTLGDVTSYAFATLPSGPHYFAVAAYTTDGSESMLTGEAEKVIP